MASFIEKKNEVARILAHLNTEQFERALSFLQHHINHRKTILAFGNGGSASNASHFASDLTQAALRSNQTTICIAANNDAELNTAISNDISFDEILATRVRSHLLAGDLLVVFSVSGTSINVTNGISEAKTRKVNTLGFFGRKHTNSTKSVDCYISVDSDSPELVETAHLFLAQELVLRC